jgi:hypothetical protein
MAKVFVTTETGSIYSLDFDRKEWGRICATERSGDIRTDEGVFYEVRDMEVGKRMFIHGPGLAFGNRWIHTSKVVEIEDAK